MRKKSLKGIRDVYVQTMNKEKGHGASRAREEESEP
jgi:hypothetical protein